MVVANVAGSLYFGFLRDKSWVVCGGEGEKHYLIRDMLDSWLNSFRSNDSTIARLPVVISHYLSSAKCSMFILANVSRST